MKIIIIRHGKVNMKWRRMSTSIQYDKDCLQYDEAPLCKTEKKLIIDIPKTIYISTLKRSKETAEEIFDKKDYIKSDLINEVLLRSGFDTKVYLPVWFWNIMGRLQWFWGCQRQYECRNDTIKRADTFIQVLIDKNEDCVIVTHGFYMQTLVKRLKYNNFKLQQKRKFYSNLDEVIAIR